MMLERHQILDLMGQLKLAGMRHAYDEVIADGIKRQHPHQHVVGELLTAEVSDKHARSIKYQMTASKLPLAKDIAGFEFAGTPINESLVRDLATGGFLASQRNVVLVGGTGSGKTHLSIAIARSCIRGGARVRFYNTTDLVNRLELEAHQDRAGKLAEHLSRLDLLVLDELGYLPFARTGGQLLFHLVSRLYERTSVIVTTNLAFGEWPTVFGDAKIEDEASTGVHWNIDAIVGELRDAREAWRAARSRNAEYGAVGFPSRLALDKIVAALCGVLFPLRLGPSFVRRHNEDAYVAETLQTALSRHYGQIRLELGYSLGDGTSGAVEEEAGRIIHHFAAALPRLRTRLDTDVEAAYVGDPAARSVDEVLLCYPCVLAIIHHRLAHLLHGLGAPLVARI